jgi:hypothetical protein
MTTDTHTIDMKQEVDEFYRCLSQGDRRASVHLARLIEADTRGTLQPFAEALAARLCDHLDKYADLGETDSRVTLDDEVYRIIRTAAIDWNGHPRNGRPGEEA